MVKDELTTMVTMKDDDEWTNTNGDCDSHGDGDDIIDGRYLVIISDYYHHFEVR